MVKNIGFAVTGSFCTHDKILQEIKQLVEKGYNIIPILSFSVSNIGTRFGTASDFYNKVKEITGNTPVDSLVSAEPIGPSGLIDALVIAPCTGNTMAKLANAVTDTPVTMVAKAHLRNNKPVILGISTNDALGLNMTNLARLISSKNIYFVPFGQDDYVKKPNSLISDFSLIEETIRCAEEGKQLQPILLKNNVK